MRNMIRRFLPSTQSHEYPHDVAEERVKAMWKAEEERKRLERAISRAIELNTLMDDLLKRRGQ